MNPLGTSEERPHEWMLCPSTLTRGGVTHRCVLLRRHFMAHVNEADESWADADADDALTMTEQPISGGEI